MQCTSCDRKSTLFLCSVCTTELRGMFTGLPRWLRYLEETAYGQATMADDGRHTRSRGYHLDGDATVGSYGSRALAVFLSAGRVNLKAVRLLDEVHALLGTWFRHLCEARGITIVIADTNNALCAWLAHNVHANAADEAAADCYRDISNSVGRIEHAINPPIPPRMCGPCPQPDGTGHTCSTRLMAAPHETTVHCPACGTVHEVAELIRKLMDDVDWYPLSVQELSLALAAIGQPVPVKTIYRWTYEARLQSCGTKNGKPLYRLSDARQLSSERKRKVG